MSCWALYEHKALSVFKNCPAHRWSHAGLRVIPPAEARREHGGRAITGWVITVTDDGDLLPCGLPFKDYNNWHHAVYTCAALQGGVLLIWYKDRDEGEVNPLCQHLKLRRSNGTSVRGEVMLLVVPASLCDPPLPNNSQIFFAPDLHQLAYSPTLHATLHAQYFYAARLACAPPAQLITSPPYVDLFSAAERRAPRRALRHGVDRAVHGA